MEEIKSVRVRVNSSYELDFKLTLFRENNQKRKVVVYPEGRLPGMEFGNRWRDSSDNEVINDYLSGMSKSGNLPEDYEIIQDPWKETVPKIRSFGFDPYYLNNGSRVYIDWTEGTTSAGGTKWSDQEGNELDETSLGEDKSLVTKSVRIVTDSEILMTNKNGTLSKYEIGDNQQEYQGSTIGDLNILETVIFLWKMKVPNYDLRQCEPNNEFCNTLEYKSPIKPLPPESTEESTTNEISKEKLDNLFTFNVEKEQTFIIVSTGTQSTSSGDKVGATSSSGKGSEIGELLIVDDSELFVFQDDSIYEEFLDDEYVEADFDGVPQKDWEEQEEVANNQEDSISTESTPTAEKVNIQPVNNFDDLLRLAGKLARELGKNERVKYENLRQGYIKGVHGLCPQGTQAVLAALTGIKGLGKITGNADWFSFKTPGTGGGNSQFNKSIDGVVYYNDKVKITQKNGSWQNTYLQDKSQWQVGDVIAMGYTGGKPYGHIQVWTGYNWMSDFKQNRIQQNNIDPNTVALWRLNEKGIEAVRSQSGVVA